MKSSKKLLAWIGVIVLIVFLISVLVLKQEAKRVVMAYQAETNYQRHDVGEFQRVILGPGWDVYVTNVAGEGVSIQHNEINDPKVRNENGTLYFVQKLDSNRTDPVNVIIRSDHIKYIKAAKGTNIQLAELELDSLSVELEDHQSIMAVDANFKYLKITSADGVSFVSSVNE